ncbi:glycine cleavage system protein R [Sneathiella chinensis]|uniref:ACT domain-containing protein n=1 Tax=Sneathiella chinensis TaxID=349750 RepID=A0ABQ5U905_9PROT|nr:ACT domain-containing protein [Sneathiella chinensis]GLQ07797.1 hypothetical protein GCM10007924_30190 [Sneathiella chinensis]
MDSYKALLTIYSNDRVGLISTVTQHLFDKGINLGDTSFAVLGQGGEFTSLLEVPSDLAPSELASELRSLDGMEDAEIDVRRFSLRGTTPPPTTITHRIKCSGEDQPGLLARLSEVFIEFDANIVRLKSDQHETDAGTRYVSRFSVYIPEARAENCLAALYNTATALGQEFRVDAVET